MNINSKKQSKTVHTVKKKGRMKKITISVKLPDDLDKKYPTIIEELECVVEQYVENNLLQMTKEIVVIWVEQGKTTLKISGQLYVVCL